MADSDKPKKRGVEPQKLIIDVPEEMKIEVEVTGEIVEVEPVATPAPVIEPRERQQPMADQRDYRDMQIQEITSRLDVMDRRMWGSSKEGSDRSLQNQVDGIEATLKKLELNTARINLWMLFVTIVLAVAVILLGVLVFAK